MQQNQISKIEGLDNNLKLDTVDIAMNKVSELDGLAHLTELTELWMNWNNLEDTQANRDYLAKLQTLRTIYLADNPVSNV